MSLLISAGCSTEPEPLRFGHDSCAHCKMSISDQRFGAEIVTKKGKKYKYDAAECMLRATDEKMKSDAAGYWVIDASGTGNLVNAETAYYLVSDKLPSPMGANISAFGTEQARDKAHAEFGGQAYTWNDVKTSLNR